MAQYQGGAAKWLNPRGGVLNGAIPGRILIGVIPEGALYGAIPGGGSV